MVSTPPHIQIINDATGEPAFVVIPYWQYFSQLGRDHLIPPHVVGLIVDGLTPIRAWREHLNLTQKEAANRLGISQSAFAQQETVNKPRKITREKIAKVFGIHPNQLKL